MADLSERLINPDGDRPDLSWIRPGSYGRDGSPIDWSRPVHATGELRNPPERPRPWHMPVAEAISPTMGGYGLGYGLGSAGLAAKNRQYGEALGELGLLAAGMIMPGPKVGTAGMIMPGPKVGTGSKSRGLAPTHAPVGGLGYYSKALDSAMGLPQAKGTPEQMLAQLKAAGVKQAEIEATGLAKALEGKSFITRDEIVKHLQDNGVVVKEGRYDRESETGLYKDASPDELADHIARDAGYSSAETLAREQGKSVDDVRRELVEIYGASYTDDRIIKDRTKWSAYSLDPSNPTYRETVLHLPSSEPTLLAEIKSAKASGVAPAVIDAMERRYMAGGSDFRSGHFDEPNIVGHMMTSMTTHEGKPVYTIDQIQSDWGQKLRDKGVRDEAKIADLQRRVDAQGKRWAEDAGLKKLDPDAQALAKEAYPDNRDVNGYAFGNHWHAVQKLRADGNKSPELRERASDLWSQRQTINGMYEPTLNMLRAELRTAEAATPRPSPRQHHRPVGEHDAPAGTASGR